MTDGAKAALIIGASRGLGLGLAVELTQRGWAVTGTVRTFHGEAALREAGAAAEMLDMNDAAAGDAFAARLAGRLFDVVFLNAGIGGPRDKTAATVTAEEMAEVMMTNAIAPVRLAMKLAPLVRPRTGILAFMSSLLGSVGQNTHGWVPIYSASKAALNHLSRGFAARLKGEITVLTVHPGWVRTDMGGPEGDIDVATSAKGMVDVLAKKAGAGGHMFVDYEGRALPW